MIERGDGILDEGDDSNNNDILANNNMHNKMVKLFIFTIII